MVRLWNPFRGGGVWGEPELAGLGALGPGAGGPAIPVPAPSA